MKVFPIQEAFNAGEISPSVYGRYSSDGYKQGLKKCLNAITDSRGPFRRRSGTEFIYQITGKAEARTFDFHVNRAEAYAVVMVETDGYVFGATNRELGPEQVSNWDFQSDEISWDPDAGDSTKTKIDFDSEQCNLYVEDVNTNLLLWSQELWRSIWTLTNATMTKNAAIAPDSTQTAEEIKEDGTAAVEHKTHQGSIAGGGNVDYAASIRVKQSAGDRDIILKLYDTAAASYFGETHLDISGEVTTLASGTSTLVTDLGNGWYQLDLVATAPNGTGNIEVHLLMDDGSKTGSYNGDSTSALYLWGADIKQASSVTAYEKAEKGYYAEIRTVVTLDNDTADQSIEINLNAGGSSAADGCEIKIGTTPGGSEITSDTLFGNELYFLHEYTPAASPIYITIRQKPVAAGTNNYTRIKNVSVREVVSGGATSVQTFTHPYKDSDLENVQGTISPTGLVMYFMHNDYAPRKLTLTPPATWVFSTVSFTATPGEWIAGNYPSCMVFFQGRSWWAGCPSDPETFWASKSADYENMTTGATATDALKFSIAEHGLIVWLAASKNLLIGSELAEWVVTSEGGVIYSGDIQVEKQSGNGSKGIAPEMLGNNVLYVSSDGRKLRQMYFQWTEEGFLSLDVTYANDHINRGNIRSVAFGRNPDQAIFMPQKTGELVGCSYYREGNKNPVYGWHRHRFDGMVKDMVAIEYQGSTQYWMAVVREIEGAYEVHVEIYSEDPDRVKHYMDSWLEVRSETPVNQVTGLEHLNGRVANVITDGGLHDDVEVVDGTINLSETAYVVSVGLPYRTEVKTLPFSNAASSGQTASWKKRYSKIFLLLNRSALPLINGKRAPERDPDTLMNEAEGPYTGLVEVHNLGFDRNGEIDVVQDLPLPLECQGIYGEMAIDAMR